MIVHAIVDGSITYEVEQNKNDKYHLVVKIGKKETERTLLRGDDGQAITGYVAACNKLDEIVAERKSRQPA